MNDFQHVPFAPPPFVAYGLPTVKACNNFGSEIPINRRLQWGKHRNIWQQKPSIDEDFNGNFIYNYG
jgi:hypothetical protein